MPRAIPPSVTAPSRQPVTESATRKAGIAPILIAGALVAAIGGAAWWLRPGHTAPESTTPPPAAPLAASDHAMLWPTVAALGPMLEQGGAGDLVARADARLGTTRGLFGVIGTVDVRIARRHASPSERDASRAAAQRVLDALASSDLRLPLEDEMRRLAAAP